MTTTTTMKINIMVITITKTPTMIKNNNENCELLTIMATCAGNYIGIMIITFAILLLPLLLLIYTHYY